MIRLNVRYFLLALALGQIPQLSAATILTFNGLRDSEEVLDFYGGGTGSLGSFHFDYGVSFSPGTVLIVDSDVGGSGNFANAPSPFGVVFSRAGSVTANVSAGFIEALNFHFVTAALALPSTVTVFDGLNGSGQQLASATINPLLQNCPGDPQGGVFGCWQFVTVPFSGMARSFVVSGPANQFGLDNIGLRLSEFEPALVISTSLSLSPEAVVNPEPSTLVLMGGALGAVWMARRRLRR